MMNNSRCDGFTLIELLVILTILVVSSSFVMPNLWKQYAKSLERSDIQTLAASLHEERRKAYVLGQVVDIDVAFIQQALPVGWVISDMQPATLYFLPSGTTKGGMIEIVSESGYQWQLNLRPFDGYVEITRL